MSMPLRICVVFNPAAKGDKARRFRHHLNQIGGHCVLKPTSGPGGGRILAAEAVRQGFDCIFAAGGDGTINEVLNGIADVPEGLARTRLGVLPLGTANVFARELGLPLNWRRAWQAIQNGGERSVDLVRTQFTAQGQSTRRYFVQVAGAGLDARATQLVDWQWKKKVSFFAYITAGLRALGEPQPTITVEAGARTASAALVLIGNGRHYGGPFALFPAARIDDGHLDLRLFERPNPRLVLAFVVGILAGRVGRAGRSLNLCLERFRLSSADRVPLQIDGEYVGELPAEFEIVPRALRVVIPG